MPLTSCNSTLVSVFLRERILNSTTVLLYCTVVFYLIPNSIYWPPWWGMWEQISRVFHQSKQGCRLSCVERKKSFFSCLSFWDLLLFSCLLVQKKIVWCAHLIELWQVRTYILFLIIFCMLCSNSVISYLLINLCLVLGRLSKTKSNCCSW